METGAILYYVLAAVAGWVVRHWQGQGGAPALPPALPQPPAPAQPVSLPAELLALVQRPAFQALLHLLAIRAAATPTQIDDLIVKMAQDLTAPPAPASPPAVPK